MAISIAQYVDLLFKKLQGVAKTANNTVKGASNESIASPAFLRGDIIWMESNQIPSTAQVVPGITQALTGSNSVQCAPDTTVPPIGGVRPTWLSNETYWIPQELGATWLPKVYVGPSGAANIEATGTQIFAAGIGGVGEYYFDTQAGVLNFIGETIPSALSAGNVVYIAGYQYVGVLGVQNSTGNVNLGNLSISNTTISANIANASITLDPSGNGVVVIDTTTGLVLPVGNTAQRPTSPASGTVRLNNSDGLIEFYNGVVWASLSSAGAATITNQTINPNGSSATYTLDQESTSAGILVTINGVGQTPDVDYTVSTNNITFTTIPIPTDIIQIRFLVGVASTDFLTNSSGNAVVRTDSTGNIVLTAPVGKAVTSNVDILTTGLVSVTGNITGNYFIGNGSQLTGLTSGYGNSNVTNLLANFGSNLISTSGNVTSGNLLTGGLVSSTGSIIGAVIAIPAGALTLTNQGSVNDIIAGTKNVGQVIVGGITQTGAITVGQSTATQTLSLATGATGNGNTKTINIGTSGTGNSTTSIIIGPTVVNGGFGLVTVANNTSLSIANAGASALSVVGTVTGGNITATSNLSVGSGTFLYNSSTITDVWGGAKTGGGLNIGAITQTGTINVALSTATQSLLLASGATSSGNTKTVSIGQSGAVGSTTNITMGPSVGVGTVNIGSGTTMVVANTGGTALSVVGNITGGNMSVGTGTVRIGNLVNNNANGVGNIGSATTYFDTVFAKAASAQYADLAEKFLSDQPYEPGTVLIFAGNTQVTACTNYADSRAAGIVSTNPAYLMNTGVTACAVSLALAGQVPCKVIGPLQKGDVLTTSTVEGYACKLDSNDWKPGVIVGKALENCGPGMHVISVVALS